jgi:hypothetical protein
MWFYRVYDPTESKGRPYIYMNGAVVGISDTGYAFYRDVPAGLYSVSVESYGRDLFQFRDVALVPGQQAYVRISSLRSWVESGRNFQSRYVLCSDCPAHFCTAGNFALPVPGYRRAVARHRNRVLYRVTAN